MTLSPPSRFFPPVDMADSDGLLFIGGELTPAWLLDAYRHGIFPWPIFQDPELMAWWSPDPRAIIELSDLHISRSLRRTCRRGHFEVTCDQDFSGVLQGCSTAQDRADATWLTPEITGAYERLHTLGVAHSVEVWHDGQLAGGTYGVALGGLFAAESMFYRVRDASKVAIVYLLEHLAARGYRLLDIQQLTDHTARLGAIEISRRHYLARLADAISRPATFGEQIIGPDWRQVVRRET